MKIAFVTSCTHTRTEEDKAKVADLPVGLTIREGLEGWKALLDKHEPSTTSRQLYRGIGFQTVIKIQEAFRPDTIKIVTGGQGLIDIDEPIVPYDFSADPKERHNIQQHVTKEPFIPSVWWEGINTLRGKGPHPTADTILSHDLVIISLGKVFLRYCATDILQMASQRPDALRILLAASSVGSVPAQLRPFIIAFDRGVIEHIPGNRNDGQHRAAYLFFQLLKEDPEFGSLPIQDQRVHFMDEISTTQTVDIEALLSDRPNLLELPPEQAYRLLRREQGNLGGRMKFRSIFRKLQGTSEIPDQDTRAAVDILKGMDFLKAVPTEQDDEDKSIEAIRMFIAAFRKVAPGAQFQAQHITDWGQTYYKIRAEPVPSYIASPQKLVFLLKANAEVLGIKDLGKAFGLA